MFRYLAEPRNILAEPLGSAEPRLGITGLEGSKGYVRLGHDRPRLVEIITSVGTSKTYFLAIIILG